MAENLPPPGSRKPAVHGQAGFARTSFSRRSLLAGLAATAKSQNRSDAERPNIVLFLSDDHGYWDSSVYGSRVVQTPAMENLAARGMVFSGAFTGSPTCVPSRSIMMSGLMPARNGALPNHSGLSAGIPTLPTFLKRAGYRVAHFGKGHFQPRENYPEHSRDAAFTMPASTCRLSPRGRMLSSQEAAQAPSLASATYSQHFLMSPARRCRKALRPFLRSGSPRPGSPSHGDLCGPFRRSRLQCIPIRCVRTAHHKYILNLHPEFKYTTHMDKAGTRDGRYYFDSWVRKAQKDPSAAAIVHRYHEHTGEELYDVAADPHEIRNLAADPEHQRTLEDLRQKVHRWMGVQGDEGKVFGNPTLFAGHSAP